MERDDSPLGPGRVVGAVLAGGQSRRFGRDKALARLGGRSLLERAAESLRPAADEVWVIAKETEPYRGFGLPLLTDDYTAATPLSGILTAADQLGRDDWLLLTACDIVLFDGSLTERLLRAAAKDDAKRALLCTLADRLQPFPGLYPAGHLDRFRRAYAAGEMEMTRIIARMPHRSLNLDADEAELLPPLANINRPGELERLEELLRRNGRRTIAGEHSGSNLDNSRNPYNSRHGGEKR